MEERPHVISSMGSSAVSPEPLQSNADSETTVILDMDSSQTDNVQQHVVVSESCEATDLTSTSNSASHSAAENVQQPLTGSQCYDRSLTNSPYPAGVSQASYVNNSQVYKDQQPGSVLTPPTMTQTHHVPEVSNSSGHHRGYSLPSVADNRIYEGHRPIQQTGSVLNPRTTYVSKSDAMAPTHIQEVSNSIGHGSDYLQPCVNNSEIHGDQLRTQMARTTYVSPHHPKLSDTTAPTHHTSKVSSDHNPGYSLASGNNSQMYEDQRRDQMARTTYVSAHHLKLSDGTAPTHHVSEISNSSRHGPGYSLPSGNNSQMYEDQRRDQMAQTTYVSPHHLNLPNGTAPTHHVSEVTNSSRHGPDYLLPSGYNIQMYEDQRRDQMAHTTYVSQHHLKSPDSTAQTHNVSDVTNSSRHGPGHLLPSGYNSQMYEDQHRDQMAQATYVSPHHPKLSDAMAPTQHVSEVTNSSRHGPGHSLPSGYNSQMYEDKRSDQITRNTHVSPHHLNLPDGITPTQHVSEVSTSSRHGLGHSLPSGYNSQMCEDQRRDQMARTTYVSPNHLQLPDGTAPTHRFSEVSNLSRHGPVYRLSSENNMQMYEDQRRDQMAHTTYVSPHHIKLSDGTAPMHRFSEVSNLSRHGPVYPLPSVNNSQLYEDQRRDQMARTTYVSPHHLNLPNGTARTHHVSEVSSSGNPHFTEHTTRAVSSSYQPVCESAYREDQESRIFLPNHNAALVGPPPVHTQLAHNPEEYGMRTATAVNMRPPVWTNEERGNVPTATRCSSAVSSELTHQSREPRRHYEEARSSPPCNASCGCLLAHERSSSGAAGNMQRHIPFREEMRTAPNRQSGNAALGRGIHFNLHEMNSRESATQHPNQPHNTPQQSSPSPSGQGMMNSDTHQNTPGHDQQNSDGAESGADGENVRSTSPEEEFMCAMCPNGVAAFIILPCGHGLYCKECIDKLLLDIPNPCPSRNCRKKIYTERDIMKVYVSK